MADEKEVNKSWGVKLDLEVKQELLKLIEGYKTDGAGTTNEDFLKTLMEVYKTNKIIGSVTSTDKDIKELNKLTSRMYDIYSNILERNNTDNNSLQVEFSRQLSLKDDIINNLKAKNEAITEEFEMLKGAYNNIVEEKNKLQDSNKQLQKLNDSLELNNSKLVEDTKVLSEVKQENLKLSSENETNKGLLALQQADNIKKDDKISGLNDTITGLKAQHTKEITELTTKHDTEISENRKKATFDIDKKELDLNKLHQAAIQGIHENYNKKIEEYQKDYKELLEQIKQMEKSKTAGAGTKDNKNVVTAGAIPKEEQRETTTEHKKTK